MDMGLMEHLGDAFFDDDFLPSPEDPFDPSIVKRELQVPDPLDASISRPNSTSITNNTNNTNNNDNNPPGIKTATLTDNASGKATANPTIDTASKHDPTHTKHSPSMTATTTTSTSTTSHEHDHDRRHSTERVSNLNENDNENDDDNETPSDLLVFKSSKSHLRSSTSSSAPRPMSTEVLAPIPDLSDPAACLPSSFVDGDDEEEDDDDDVTSSPLQENRRPRHHHNVGYQQPAGGSAQVAGVSSNYALQQQNYSFMHPSAHGNVTPNNSSSTVGNAVLNCAYTNANGTSSTRTGHTAQVNASGGMNGTENMGNICRPSTLDNSNNNISSFTNTNANNLFSHSQLPTTEMDTFTFPTLSTNSTPHQNARQQPHYQAHSFPQQQHQHQQLFSNANSSTPSTTPRKEARSCMDGGNLPTVTTPVSAKDKLAQRKLRNKESARRYREKQVARRRHLEHYTRTLSEQNRELENLHDRLLSLTCTPIPSAVVDIDVNVISNAVPQPPQLASSSSYQHPHQQQQQQPHHQSGNFGCNEQSFIFQQQQQNQQHNHSHQHQQQHQRQNHQFSSAPSVCTPNSNTTTPGGPHHSYLGSANGPMCQQNLFNS